MTRLLTCVRLDDSDRHAYEQAADAGEWCVPGGFAFWDLDDRALTEGKSAEAFRHGFLGLRSYGRSTVVCVGEIPDDELQAVTEALARHLVERYGAPSIEAAMPVAREELALAQSLCEQPVGTLLTVERELIGGEIAERFKVVRDRRGGVDHDGLKLWELVPDAGDGHR